MNAETERRNGLCAAELAISLAGLFSCLVNVFCVYTIHDDLRATHTHTLALGLMDETQR